jgi:phosphoserine phosphatase RsbU/P
MNATLQRDNTNMMFVTTFYGILDMKTGVLTYSNAGHNPPHIIRQNGSIETISKSHGMALGVTDDLKYTQDEVTLAPGDMLYLFTDGVTEAENGTGALFSEQKLTSSLASYHNLSANELVNTIRSDLTNYAAGTPQSDDITMLAIRLIGKQT